MSSNDEQPLDLDALDKEVPLDIFNMPTLPNAPMIARQETDMNKENSDDDIPINPNPPLSIDDTDYNALPTPLTRQKTDDTPHNTETDNIFKPQNNEQISDTENTFALPSLLTRQKTDDTPHAIAQNPQKHEQNPSTDFALPSLLTRQKTDDTPHAIDPNNPQNSTDEHKSTNTDTDPIPVFNLTRQITDDTPHAIVHETDTAFTMDDDIPIHPTFDLPPMSITRQQTDDAKEAHISADEIDIENTLDMPANISRQRTDQTDKDASPAMPNDMPALNTLTFSGLQRQKTDTTDPETHRTPTPTPELSDGDMAMRMPPSLLQRQKTDDTPQDRDREVRELKEDVSGDVQDMNEFDFSVGGLNRHITDVVHSGNSVQTGDDIGMPTDMATEEAQTQTQSTVMDGSSEQIRFLPPRVSGTKNQYLDEDLLMFDDNGLLLPDLLEKGNVSGNSEDSIQEIEDDSCNQFIEHKQPIICMGFNPKKQYEIITGSQDETCYIWNIIEYDSSRQQSENKENNYVSIVEHSDTVMDVAYNSNGKFVATASMDNSLKIFNCNKNYNCVSTFEIGNEISFVEWHPNKDKKYRNTVMAGAFDKNVWMYKYDKSNKTFENCQILSGHSGKIECGGFTKYNNGMNGYSGDDDGMIIIWENVMSDVPFNGTQKYSFKPNKNLSTIYHESGVNVIDDCGTAPLLVSGSSDYSVCLINYENGKILHKLGKHSESVECVRFNKLYKPQIKYTNYVSSSGLDGSVKIWDLNNGKIRNELVHNDGVIVHEWFNTETNSNLIVCGCMNGIVYVWDSRSGKVEREFKGHQKCAVQSVKVSSDDKYIVSGADDNIAMVWQL